MNRRVYTDFSAFSEQNSQLGTGLPYSENTAILGETVTVGNKIAPNRLVCQAMEGCDGKRDGSPDELTLRRYRRFAEGGAGIIWFEATACREEGRANPRQLWITEKNLDSFKALVEEIRETAMKKNGYAPLILMQDTHSGRYSKPNGVPAPIIAYNNPIFEKDHPIDPSRIISDEELDRVKDDLVRAAHLAELAGFDGVDIKCCHRYLNSELLSAYEREGRYGGSLENRTRLLRESVIGAKETCDSDFIVSTRLNVYDGFVYPYGFGVKNDGSLDFDPTEPTWLLRQLQASGVPLVNITMGNPYFNPHVNRPYATGGYEQPEHPLFGVYRMLEGIGQIKRAVPGMTVISSGISFLGGAAPGVLAGAIREGWFDMAGFGRQTLAYPDVAKDLVTAGEMKTGNLCLTCGKCTEIMRQKGGTPGCVVRDAAVYAPLYREYVLKK